MTFKAWWASLAALGPPAMFLITAADTAILPTAQAVDLLILAQAAAAPERWLELGLFAVSGSTFGAMALYALARKGGGWALGRTFKPERIESVRVQLRKYDAWALAVPTLLPIPFSPMKLFIASAGALGVSPLKAAVSVALARGVRYFTLILLGAWLGDDAWRLIKENIGVALLVCAAAGGAYWLWQASKKRRAAAADVSESSAG